MQKKQTYEELEQRVKELEQEAAQRKRIEEAIKGAEQEKGTILNTLVEHVIHQDTTMKILWANQAACESAGLTREQLLGRRCYEIWPQRQEPCPDCPVVKAMETGRPQEVEKFTPDGRAWFIRGYPVRDEKGEIVGAIETTLDITERRKAEEALRESEARLQLILQTIPSGLFTVDLDRKITYWNKQAEEITGLKAEEAIGKYCLEAFDCEECRKECGLLNDKTDKPVYEKECTIHIDGRDITVSKNTDILKDSEGNTIGGLESFIDTTERKRVEKALRESEKKYSTLVENSLTGIYIDHGGKIVFANNKFAEIYKYSKDQLIGMESWKLVHPEDRELTSRMRAKRLKGEDAPEEYEARGLTKDGETIWLGRRNTRIEYKGRPAILGNIADITQRKRTEEALRESMHRMHVAYDQSIIYARQLKKEISERKQAEEKLLTYHEKLRLLASKLSLAEERQRRCVAIEVHDRISQNLAFVKMKLGTLRASTSSSSFAGAMDEMLKLVDETIQNTRALISELGSPILYELGFVPAVEWLTQQAQNQHGIVLDFEDDGQFKPLSEDVRVLLFQAVRELLVNIAKHAQARTAKVSITRDGDQVRLDVEDDGVGFDSAEIGPSVDTTGKFGLFSIRVRLEPLGGHMEVESKPGHGTRVTLMAPLKRSGENKEEKVS